MPTLETDVLIAGGGPCGLMLANELGPRGVRALLVDMKPGTAFNPQANATQARTMEHYRRLGIAGDIRALGLPADYPTDIAYFTRYVGFELARLRLPGSAKAVHDIRGMGGSWSAAELPHRVSQKYVEACLRRHAEKWPANDVRYGWQLVDYADLGTHVEARVAPVAGGDPVQVRARYLLGADGPRSMVRTGLGIHYEGQTGIRRDFMGGKMFAVYLRSPGFYDAIPHDRAWMYVSVNARRRAFMAAVDGAGEFAFHAAVHDGEDAESWTEADARRIFAEAMGKEIPIDILSVGVWTAGHALVAEKMRRGRVFIGGDAAHLFTPTGGLGYNTAVEDAVNLGWKLAAVIRGQAPASLLDSYEAERQPLARRNTGYARQFADSVGLFAARPELDEDTPAGQAARREAEIELDRHVRLEFNIPGVTFGGRYDASPVIVPDGTAPPADAPGAYQPTACPGGRPPHLWLADGSSLYDSFHREWTLLDFGAGANAARGFEDAARELGMDLRVVRHDDERLPGLYEARLALIRPDHIVAWRGNAAEDARRVLEQANGRSS